MPNTFMSSTKSEGDSQTIVRRFSRKATNEFPEDDLVTSLAVKEARDENEEQRRRSLAYLWQDLFRTQHAAMTHNGTAEDQALDQASLDDSPPRLEDVYKAVTAASDQVKTNREESTIGRLKGRFNKLCSNLNSHRDLFAVVPDGDKYISILAGSFSALVKASARYEKIGETVGRALEELSDRLPYWHRQMRIHRDNAFMQRYIALLYVAIFRFLTDIMKEWFKSGWERLRRAFDTDFIDRRLNTATDEIKNLSDKLEKESKLATEARIQMMPTSGDFTIWMRQFQEELFSRMGETIQNQLRCEYETHFAQMVNMVTARSPSPMLALSGHNSAGSADIGVMEDWSSLAAPFEKVDQKDLRRDLVERSRNLHMNFDILKRIQYWFLEPVSRTLWICGLFQAPIPSRTTLMSAYIFDVAEKAKVPVIAYFCDHMAQNPPEKALLNLTYSLIFQIAAYMQNSPNTDWSALRTQFDKLDGSIDSLQLALTLLEEIISNGPELIFCIIDGLEKISYPLKNRPELAEFLQILQRRTDTKPSRKGPHIKAFFTTDGFTDALAHLDAEERLEVQDFERDTEAEFGPGQDPMTFLTL
ncbi:hypothetical protein EV356DRAFT_556061 [Viridothelium virens]|uniref:Uncharacterized protein n=1 Tax=Viridothelium virens TaxID=1048519 RepID=A0A6A6GUX7_VIRVR|nr:hypothetical protein EV356DRAFT_556061 [Viridothelium virens]